MIQEILEQLFEFAAKSISDQQILAAKKTYQMETGILYEDDKSYNSRMALFLEWYLFNNCAPKSSKTVLEVLLENNSEECNTDKLKIYKSISKSIQSLFLIQKVHEDRVKAINLFNDEIYLVQEKDSRLIFKENDIFQGRIIYFQKYFHFTGNFCFHPKKSHKYIRYEIKLIAKSLNQHKKDLAKTEKTLLKANTKLTRHELKIENLNEKLHNINSENKVAKLNQKLKLLVEEKETQIRTIQELRNEVSFIKNDKIKNEGNKQINALINRLTYMNLKWERSRQIDITDIYNN
tara:strand:- start:794 stop:1669 length:876 start_codon:yes stop_codon:yes gene_type:complete